MKRAAKIVLTAALTAGMGSSSVYGATCTPRDHGARADGTTKDTAAIQACIDAVSISGIGPLNENDYGHVVLSAGIFLTGPIKLKRGVNLRIEKDATLLASPDRDDFPKWRFAGKDTVQPFVSAVNTAYLSITGEGTIDGNGQVWWKYVERVPDSGVLGSDHPRPFGLLFDHSRHIKVEGVTVQNSGFWQIVPYYADDVVFRGIRVLAPPSPNTDAIDPFSSSNIVIDHVFSSVGDDNIAIKSGAINSPGPDAPSRNITITDCTFERGHGLSIGSEIAGGVQNVHAERIHFKGTDQGIRIKSARDRGNDVSKISFKDITMEDVKTAILVTEYYPHPAPSGEVAAEPMGRLTPKFHSITIENVAAKNSGSAGYIVGLPESPVLGMTLKNVHLEGHTGLSIAYATLTLDDVTVVAATGREILVAPTAHVTRK